MPYDALSDILAADVISELELNSEFSALTDPQQLQILNSAQQLTADSYNKKEKDDYNVNTGMYSTPSFPT